MDGGRRRRSAWRAWWHAAVAAGVAPEAASAAGTAKRHGLTRHRKPPPRLRAVGGVTA